MARQKQQAPEETQEQQVSGEASPEKIRWKRPSGTEIETNAEPATIAACEELGWEQV